MILIATGLLLAALVTLVVLTVATARPPHVPIPDFAEHLRRWSLMHAGIEPHDHRLVVPWLRVMHALGQPLARAGVRPHVITVSGLWWALACWTLASASGRWALLATAALVVGSVTDGVDGTVAALAGRATSWGGVLDAMTDRAADVVYLLALLALGADPGGAVAAGGALFGLEYLRAVAGQQGARTTRVTVGERPTRLVLVGVTLWCAGLLPAQSALIASLGAWSVATVAVVGILQLLPAVHGDLR